MELFEVGGCVRDEILGLRSKDIDFSVVLSPEEVEGKNPFRVMEQELKRRGFTIHVSKPEYLTIRGKFPDYSRALPGVIRLGPSRMDADFVLARKEGTYSDNRRPDKVEVGTLHDDLARRDFTMNAIAKDMHGNLIDPFGGQEDIADNMIRCVGNPIDRILKEDALRGMRAIRFSITKGFAIHDDIVNVLESRHFRTAMQSISTERISDELEKMFKANTVETLTILNHLGLESTLFNGTGLRLMPTMKGK